MLARALVAGLLLLRTTGAAAAPSGPEFQVNSTSAGDQGYPALCVTADGGAVLAWESRGQDGAGNAVVVAQRAADGTPRGGEQVLSAAAPGGDQQAPAVACNRDGEFLVVWEAQPAPGGDFVIEAQRLRADGLPPREFMELPAGSHRAPAACAASSRRFILAWQRETDAGGFDILTATASIPAPPRTVNAAPGSHRHPGLACDARGVAAVVWEQRDRDGDGGAIVARRVGDVQTLGDEVQVNSTSAGDQRLPAVAALADGTFLVAWESEGQDGDESAIVARRLAADLTPLGDEFVVNSVAAFSQEQPAVAAAGRGALVAWSSPGDGDGYGVFARRVGLDGSPVGAEVLLNTTTAGTQGAVSDEGGGVAAAGNARGDLLIAWQSLRLRGVAADGDGLGIFARRGTLPGRCAGDCNSDGAVAIDELVRGVTLALTDGVPAGCTALDADGDDRVVIAELIAAVAAALNGCAP